MLPPNENPSNSGTFVFNMRMPGQYYTKEANQFYNYFRDYDPQTGRYIQSDPIGLQGGVNTYAYAEIDPMRNVDLLGLQSHPGAPSSPPSRPYIPGPFDPVIPGTPAHDIWKRLIERIIDRCTARGSSNENRCKAAWENEYGSCDRYWNLGKRAVDSCRNRANDRLRICLKGQPDGPPIWTPDELPGR
jgi:RHS repeat-associated protein